MDSPQCRYSPVLPGTFLLMLVISSLSLVLEGVAGIFAVVVGCWFLFVCFCFVVFVFQRESSEEASDTMNSAQGEPTCVFWLAHFSSVG